jgi:5-methylcytosine-specific restriction endonuclease McrA
MEAALSALVSSRSLLLNSSYEPMTVVSWQKAVVLWLQGKVEVLEFHSVFARSVSSSFQLPSIMRLKSYVRPRNRGTIRFSRENIYVRDEFTCQYCGEVLPPKHLTLDHVIPVSKKGPKTWTNVVAACRECNQRKGNRTPLTANMPLLKEPRVPTWLRAADLELRGQGTPPSWYQYLRYSSE